jgi:hypothetical protein
MKDDLDVKTPGDVASRPPEACEDLTHCRAVALRGKMNADGYVPENDAWLELLTKAGDERGLTDTKGRPRRVGRDPMTIPLAVLSAAGHPPRRTSSVVSALSNALEANVSKYDLREYSDLRRYCFDCADGAAAVRRCAVVDCPFWPYRMGRNPHNPKRGVKPFGEDPR